MRLGDGSDNEQSQADTARPPRPRGVATHHRLEQRALQFLRNGGAPVVHRQVRPLALDGRNDGHDARPFSVSHGIAHQIAKKLRATVGVCKALANALRYVDDESLRERHP